MPTNPEIFDIGQEALRQWRLNKLYVHRTPLIPSKVKSIKYGSKLWLKLDHTQFTGSYHFRGAIARMKDNPTKKPFVTASTGNHAMGAALAAHALGTKVTIVMPMGVEKHLLDKVMQYGPKIIQRGHDLNEARAYAKDLAEMSEHIYFSPCDDMMVLAGLGTVCVEVLQQFEFYQKDIHNIFAPMSDIALISAIGCFATDAKRQAGELRPKVKVWGVTALNSMTLAGSLSAGFPIETENSPTIAASEFENDVIRHGIDFRSARATVNHVVTCTEAEILVALRQLHLQEKQYVDGFSALALAGFHKVADKVKHEISTVILCSGNYDRQKMAKLVYGT
ncbi:anabolic serine threonine dehydratase precursor [Fusarium globosum]|uniref:Anabolic serine threonine dehydratase n=1 Tax=Fusarium globosum TaxID=78864 RepID=A0A8H5Y8J7_9HYPO|nr:anabolic serine threonine dehydratase precursor [Fusarium globosum]